MKIKKLLTLIIFFSSISLLSCKGQTAEPDTLRALAKKETTAIVDVRTVEEFETGHLDKAINMPLQSLADSVPSLKKYENIIVVCRSGGRSIKAKNELEKEGFTNIYNGGGWQYLKEVLEAKEDDK